MNTAILKIIIKIKHSTFVRSISKPLADFMKKFQLKQYQNSAESKRLSCFKDRYKGESCYIIGNGPSLKVSDLDKLKDCYTFAANRIFTLFDKTSWRPTFYTCVDHESYKLFGNEIQNINAKSIFLDYKGKKYFSKVKEPKIYYIFHYEPFKIKKWELSNPIISEDITKMVSASNTVTFVSIQLAIYMGFKKIYLIGVDHQYAKQVLRDGTVIENKNIKTYADGIPDSGISYQCIDATTNAYEVAKKYCDNHDIEILNATRGGKLEVFPRIIFEETLS